METGRALVGRGSPFLTVVARFRTCRGSGRSRDRDHPAEPFPLAQFAGIARALLHHVGAAPTHVVRLSLGGMVAFQLAVDGPACVRSLTIVNSGPAVVPRTLAERSGIAFRQVVTRLAGPAFFGRIVAPKLFPKTEQGELRECFKATLAANDRRA